MTLKNLMKFEWATPKGAPNADGVGKNRIFSTGRDVYRSDALPPRSPPSTTVVRRPVG